MPRQTLCVAARVLVALSALLPWPDAGAQHPPEPIARAESAMVAASNRYRVPVVYQWLAGRTYRDLWTMPIRVPVLDLKAFAGGLRPTKAGGGMQSKSLRFESVDGTEYVFRLSEKKMNYKKELFDGTPVGWVLQDQVSAMHPAAAMMSARILEAAGVLHPTATLMVLPNDTILGEYREEFAGRLGMIEEYPTVPKGRAGFANASIIVDSDSLLARMNADPREVVDARAFLTARLTDFLIGDNDRHAGNWKWARFDAQPNGPWTPIGRDRDHAFVSFDGFFIRLSRLFTPMLPEYGALPNVRGLTLPAQIDARLLAELDKPVWDSVARALQQRVTDADIHDAAFAVPKEFQSRAPRFEALLRSRRAALPKAAAEYYQILAKRVQIHGTDAADHATIVLMPDGSADVALASRGATRFHRRFLPQSTSEILVYLHGGDDTAVVSGPVSAGITIRVIGGNGTNQLMDSSSGRARTRPTRLYDLGTVDGVTYEQDTVFDRRPWEVVKGKLVPPRRDIGVGFKPLVKLSHRRGLGLTPRVGLARYGFGFDHRPYATLLQAEAEYAMQFHGARVSLLVDRRREASPLHFVASARMSMLEVINFNGLGNATIDSGGNTALTAVHATQWTLRPAIALAIGSRWDVSLGPVIQHSSTDAGRSPYLAAAAPYGIGRVSQVGMQLSAQYEWRAAPTKEEHTHHRVLIDLEGRVVPAALDVRSAFSVLSLTTGTSVTLPVPTQPLLVIRAGGTKVYGDFPYYEAATIGGSGTTRYMDPQRYAGDASVYATSELRIPLARFKLVMPIRVGVLGLTEAGRVYVNGASPGGWHARSGGGVWFGRSNASPVVTLTRTTERGHSGLAMRFGLNF